MVNPQPLEQKERRPYLVRRASEDRRIRIAEKLEREQEQSSAENVIGWILLSAAALTLIFAPADLRAGGHMIEWIAAALGIPGVVLIGMGWIIRHRLEEKVTPKGE
jgi:hypothetical protein